VFTRYDWLRCARAQLPCSSSTAHHPPSTNQTSTRVPVACTPPLPPLLSKQSPGPSWLPHKPHHPLCSPNEQGGFSWSCTPTTTTSILQMSTRGFHGPHTPSTTTLHSSNECKGLLLTHTHCTIHGQRSAQPQALNQCWFTTPCHTNFRYE
jgi:hypothetical protein